MRKRLGFIIILLALVGCAEVLEELEQAIGDEGYVVNVIDGDTIDVEIDGEIYRVRYIGANTPERDEPCYEAAKNANRALVERKTVRLVRDVSDTDRYGRLLRYVYVGDVFVNAQLIEDGYAETVRYPPDEKYFDEFVRLELAAAAAEIGCHPSGIFADGTHER